MSDIYTCPNDDCDADIQDAKPGKCPKCGTDLAPEPAEELEL